MSTTIDTVAPVVLIVSSPPRFLNSASSSLCVTVVDATATLSSATVSLDGHGVTFPTTTPAGAVSGCAALATGVEANHTATTSCVDPAGNAAIPATVWFVVDTTPPSHTTALVPDTGCVSTLVQVVGGIVTVCNR